MVAGSNPAGRTEAFKSISNGSGCLYRRNGRVVKLVYTLVLGTSAARRGGSSPLSPTETKNRVGGFLLGERKQIYLLS